MDGGGLKQFRELAGRPMIVWSIDALRAAGCDPVVVVVPPDHMLKAGSILSAWDVVIAPGGLTRQASVASGLDEVAAETVVIHDGARPLVTAELTRRVLDPLDRFDGAVAGTPMDETLKSTDGDLITGTVDRTSLWRVQTPQAFRTAVLRAAHEAASTDGFEATDDSTLVERAGGSVVLVRGPRSNIKVTFPEDFALAGSLLEDR